jgi:tetratricopeptide (TPR) repeat protein
MKAKGLVIFILIILLTIINPDSLFAQVKIWEDTMILPTYSVEAPVKTPIFLTGNSFQGAKRVVYPYAQNDVISHTKKNQAWKTLNLENEYIKLCITPEIGGKLYYAEDKSNNYNFIYRNNEVKPSNIGMTGAWVSGGIEWCVLHHHRASTMLPMDYSMSENEDGSKTIFIGETEPRHRMRWTVAVSVYPGKSYFETELSIYNPTPYTNTFLYWANVAAHTNEHYQTIFPPSVDFATFHSKVEFTHWPVSYEIFRNQNFTEGVDVSWWKNVKESASFFVWELQEDFMGGYDHGKNSGTVHIGDHNIVKGAKLWEWGSGPRGQATEGRLTETSGPYVEIMVGAFSDNQPDYTWIRPYEVKKWKQYWYPVKDIGGFKNANLNAAVNLEQRENNQVFLGYHSTKKIDKAHIFLKNGDKIIFQEDVQISPKKAFTDLIDLSGPYEFTELYTEIIDMATGESLISYQPIKNESKKDLPEVLKSPPPPEEIVSVEQCYLTGKRNEQFYKPFMKYYEEVLKRDSSHIGTNIAIGNVYLKNGDYKTARKYFATAIKRLTKDYTRPSDCEALYLQGLTLKALKLYDEAIDTLYRATWDYAFYSAAYFQLAQISCIQGDFNKALHQINESLSTNIRNNRASGLKASIQRRLGEYEAAHKTLQKILKNDPLNFRLDNEAYLIAKQSGKEDEAKEVLHSLTIKMRNFDQNYLELAVGYLNEGLLDEAKDVLQRFKGENPIILYYSGYIEDKLGNRKQAQTHMKKAQEISEEYCFPFRLETVDILKKAVEYDENDQKAYYYLGNILYNKQPVKAIEYWKTAIKKNPGLAMAFRNLGWGYYRHYKDYEKAISFYEKAISLDNSNAIVYTELDKLYELNNSPIEKRLALFDGNQDIVRKRDDSFISQITVLTLAGQPEKSIEYLKGKKFSYREGDSRVREVIIDAQLSLGLKHFREKKYNQALEHFLLAQVPDEEAGSARSGNRNIQVNYFIGRAYQAMKKQAKAEEYYKMASLAETSGRPSIMDYYKGLGFKALGKKEKAKEIFTSLIESGEKRINKDSDKGQDYFAIFGGLEADNVLDSRAYTLRGLGYKGLGKTKPAKEDLQKAVELSHANLWATTELKELL